MIAEKMNIIMVTEMRGNRVMVAINRDKMMLNSLNLKISNTTKLKIRCLKVTMM